MSSSWPTTTVGEACKITSGGTPPRDNHAYWIGDIPWVSAKDLKSDRIYRAALHISERAVEQSATKIAPIGSLLMLVRGMGLANGMQIGEVTSPVAFNQDIRAIKPPDTVLPRFLLLALKRSMLGEEGGAILSSAAHGTLKIDADALKRLTFPLPSFAEQQRIVAFLDESFAGIATAKANAEKNLQNARALFESHLQSVFSQRGEDWVEKSLEQIGKTQTGSTPKSVENGNYGATIPFIKPSDFNADGSLDYKNHGLSEKGLAGARMVPAGSVLMVCIGATIGKCGYCVRDVTTNQQINALTPIDGSSNRFLYYQMLTESFQQSVVRGSGQATLPIINKSKWSALPLWLPSTIAEQESIADKLDKLLTETQRLESIYQRKLAALDALKQSLLHQAFSGQLADNRKVASIIHFPAAIARTRPTDLHAGILAMAYQLHEKHGKQQQLGHVKAEKIAHMVEAHLGIDLGRTPFKDAAGPNDFSCLLKVGHRAGKAGYFSFAREKGPSYQITKGRLFDAHIASTRDALGERCVDVDALLELMLSMDTKQAEIFATVHAAWNNLLLKGEAITDESVVREARENWHPDKLKIPRERFFKAIEWMREKGLSPHGRGKLVGNKPKL